MKRQIICIIALFASIVSCVDEKREDPPAPLGTIKIEADLPSLGSIQPIWTVEDRIGVATVKGSLAEFSLYEGAGTSTGLFSGEIDGLMAGDSLLVCHPFLEGFNGITLPVDLARQTFVPGSIASSDITVGKGIIRSGEKAPRLVLEHILGGIEFSLENKRIGAQTVTSLGIISDGIILSGSYDVLSEKMNCDKAVNGCSTMSLKDTSVPSKGKSSWVLSVIPQSLLEGTRAFVELTPGDTLFKSLSTMIVKKDKILGLAFTLDFEGLNVSSSMTPFVNAKNPSESIPCVWFQSDSYGVFANRQNINTKFSLVEGEETADAVFLGYPDVEEGDAFTAYYPYSDKTRAEGILTFDLSSQEMSATGKLAPSDIAVAQGSFGVETEVSFSHLLGGILFEITNKSELYPLVIDSYGITSSNISLSGKLDVLKGEISADAAAEGSAVCNAGRAVKAGGCERVFLSVIPQEIAAGSTIWLKTTNGQTFSVTVDEAALVRSGEYISVPFVLEGERGGRLKDIGSCTYDTEGTVLWTSPAISPDGTVAYVTSSNYRIAAISLSGGKLASTPNWVVDVKPDAGMAGGGSNITSTPAVSSTGIYALLGKGTYASLVKILPDGKLDYYRWASYYVNGNTNSPDPASAQFEFDMECPIIFPTNDVYKERVMFSIQNGNGDSKRFATARGCGDPNSTSDTKTGGSRQTSKGTTTNLGGTMGYVGSDGWYFIAGRTGSSSPGGQIIKTNTFGGSMSGSTTASQMLGYVSATGSFANGRGSQMSQDANYVYYIGWNSSFSNYPGGNTLLFKYSKSKIKASTAISPEYIVALKGGVSTSSSSGMRGVGSVLSADGAVLYVTTSSTDDGEAAYVHAVNTVDGSVKWSHEAVAIYGVAAVDDLGNVYYNDSSKGELVQLDPNTGAEVDVISIGTVKSSPTIGPGGYLYCNTLNAEGCPTLRAFSISESNGPARGWTQLGGNPQKSGTAY